jgi:hypothetical protein
MTRSTRLRLTVWPLGPQFGVDARRSVSFPVLRMNPPDVDQQRAIDDLARAHRP